MDKHGDWTQTQDELVFYLSGIPAAFHEASQLGLDAVDGKDFQAAARQIVDRQLQTLRDPARVVANQEWDDFCRETALAGAPVQISPEMRLMQRYEAMHIRRANQAMAEFERIRGGGEEEAPQPEGKSA